MLVEPRHDLDEIAGARAVIELGGKDPVPAVAAGAIGDIGGRNGLPYINAAVRVDGGADRRPKPQRSATSCNYFMPESCLFFL